ncbi:MAG: carbamoyl-phosphate synthase large subunit [Thermoplasmata archaeon]
MRAAPKDIGLRKVMVIGSGPVVIGQAAEFDYSGSQACRALREEAIQVVLVNSNPATIMTDPDMADAVYMEPLEVDFLEPILERERPQALLAGMGGQTALNLASELAEVGMLKRFGVELLGTTLSAIEASEDRRAFAALMRRIGEPIPRSFSCGSLEEAHRAVADLGGLPVIIRPAYTLGGTGSGIASTAEELDRIASIGLAYSRIHQVLVEESVLGWKEYEYEVMRDQADNCITICSMENLDPMGIHTGESIVVAPAQTLSDRDHQTLRSAALQIIRALGIAGGCNIQFAVHPETYEYRVIEVNPRVSRSSALASKATGYPIARIAAKLAVGFHLDEVPNTVTRKTRASFEPSLDYVVTKIPRWPYDKFPHAEREIGTQMKSTGEVMAIGRSFEESLLKAIRSLEVGKEGLEPEDWTDRELETELVRPTDKRIFAIAEAFRRGEDLARVASLTSWDPFFLTRLQRLVDWETKIRANPTEATIRRAKAMGFSDRSLARISGLPRREVEMRRGRVAFKVVDTCAGEFEAATPYFYSCHEETTEVTPLAGPKVLIVGAGPIRISQGIEFDGCCVHGVMALQEEGYAALVINNNPETVSTDFDVSDRLYFDPLTLEDVLNVIEVEEPEGVILQFGGQTSVNLAVPLQRALEERGLPSRILGTSSDAMDVAEDRARFSALLETLDIDQAPFATGFSFEEVREIAARIGYPVLVRPSYVLGGRGMEIVQEEEDLERFMARAHEVSRDHPILVDKFLTHAIEVDVDAVSDGQDVFIGGIQEHIEEAGVHSGDAACILPAQTLSEEVLARIRQITHRLCETLPVIGLINLQFAVKDGTVFVLEANPRASRTVPFVSKAIGIPLAKVATKVMLGRSLRELGHLGEATVEHVAVKAPVFPFQKIPGIDAILGPEMKSTGEVMGLDEDVGRAYYKAMVSAGSRLPMKGAVYITVRDEDKEAIAAVADRFVGLGLQIYATRGTAALLRTREIPVETVYRISEGRSPDAIGLMRGGQVDLIVNTPTENRGARRDGYMMRRLAVELNIPFITTVQAARAAVEAIARAREGGFTSKPLREYGPPGARLGSTSSR